MFASDMLKTVVMKNLVLSFCLLVVFLSSCTMQKITTYQDDVYVDPARYRAEVARVEAIKQQQREAYAKRYNDSIALLKQAQKAKDDANPYYKDREFKYDDYYDYEYATRLKRFDNSINGLGYYDNYYTNSYWYNNDPYSYGVSVYNGYSWWGSGYNPYNYSPSAFFHHHYGFGGNGYSPYMLGYLQGYNNGFVNGYSGNYYGFGNPYGSYVYPNTYGNYNGWGYYNSYDHNSSYTYGPRSSHGGSNNSRTSNPGINTNGDTYYNAFITSVVETQARDPKFTDVEALKNIKASRATMFESSLPGDASDYQMKPNVMNTVPVKNGEVQIGQPAQQSNKTTPPNVVNQNGSTLNSTKNASIKNKSVFYQQEEQPTQKAKSHESNFNVETPIQQYVPVQPAPRDGGTPVNNGGHRPR